MYNNIKKKKKKGIQGGQSSLQTDSITCGRLLLLKKKDNLEWTEYLAPDRKEQKGKT